MFCPKCGKEISDDAEFCAFCGTNTNDDGKDVPKVKETSINNTFNSKIIFIIVVAVVIVLLAFLIYKKMSSITDAPIAETNNVQNDTNQEEYIGQTEEESYGLEEPWASFSGDYYNGDEYKSDGDTYRERVTDVVIDKDDKCIRLILDYGDSEIIYENPVFFDELPSGSLIYSVTQKDNPSEELAFVFIPDAGNVASKMINIFPNTQSLMKGTVLVVYSYDN